MATIRIPESAEPLLPFCRTSGSNGPHVWETYADMICFLAAYAFGHGEMPVGVARPAKSASPIELGVFRSRSLYSHLLALSIAVHRDWIVAKAPDEIAAIAERFADAGARLLSYEAELGNIELLIRRLLADLIRASAPSIQHPAI